MTPIELKKLRSTKKEPAHYVAYMPLNGKYYNLAEVIAEGVNRLYEREISDD